MSNQRPISMQVETAEAIKLPARDAAKPALADHKTSAVETPILTALVALAICYAWTQRNEGEITAETGAGYFLGITGSLMMLALLGYPLRKRLQSMRFLGSIPNWFRVHMMLGVLGPALVVLHSNFNLGSTNSRAAMFAMLVVAGSGFIGRFLYSRIHRGLFGKRQSTRERLSELDELRLQLAPADCRPGQEQGPAAGQGVVAMLSSYQVSRLGGANSWLGSLSRTMTGPFSRALLRGRLLRAFRRERVTVGVMLTRDEEKKFLVALDRFFHSMGRAEAFAFYERSFAAWHLLHLPLFAILILAAIAHVIAVHLY